MNNTQEKAKDDLEKIRDERCFPIVRSVFEEFPSGLVVDPKDQKELQLKCLSAMLAADLNIAIEVSYVPQVILGVLSALNKTMNECGRVNDEERYRGIAEECLQIVADQMESIKLGSVTQEDTEKDFAPIKVKLMALFEVEKLSEMEVKYVIQKILEKFTDFHNAISNSISSSTARMEAKILGIDTMSDLGLKKLNEVLIQK